MPMHFTPAGLHINHFTPNEPPPDGPHEPADVAQVAMEVMSDGNPAIATAQLVMEVMSDV